MCNSAVRICLHISSYAWAPASAYRMQRGKALAQVLRASFPISFRCDHVSSETSNSCAGVLAAGGFSLLPRLSEAQ